MGEAPSPGLLRLDSCAAARACSRACCLARALLSPCPRSIMGPGSKFAPVDSGLLPPVPKPVENTAAVELRSGASGVVLGELAERANEPRLRPRTGEVTLPNPEDSVRRRISRAASDASLVAGLGGRSRCSRTPTRVPFILEDSRNEPLDTARGVTRDVDCRILILPPDCVVLGRFCSDAAPVVSASDEPANLVLAAPVSDCQAETETRRCLSRL